MIIMQRSYLDCTGRPSARSPCRACSCCAAHSHADQRGADPPENADDWLMLTMLVIILVSDADINRNSGHYFDDDVDSSDDIDIDAHCMPSHYSTHATVVEELRVEVHSTSRLNEISESGV